MADLKKEYATKVQAAEERHKKRIEAFELKVKEETEKNPDYRPSNDEVDAAERMSDIEEPDYNEQFNK